MSETAAAPDPVPLQWRADLEGRVWHANGPAGTWAVVRAVAVSDRVVTAYGAYVALPWCTRRFWALVSFQNPVVARAWCSRELAYVLEEFPPD